LAHRNGGQVMRRMEACCLLFTGYLIPGLQKKLKHTARSFFSFDGGPMPALGFEASPGVAVEFMPNWNVPYDGGHH
jgi:hypothetical protein